MMNEHDAEFGSIIELINRETEFTLLSHVSPDGDTLGSALALYALLVKLGKKVELVCANPVPKIYSFLPNSEKVLLPAKQVPEGLHLGDAISVFLYNIIQYGIVCFFLSHIINF